MPKEGGFHTTGSESYDVKGQKPTNDRIVLNIQEKEASGIKLDKDEKKKVSSGSFFMDIYYKINSFFVERSSVGIEVKAQFFHLLGVMLNSGIPMLRSIESLVVQMEDSPRMKMILLDIHQNIEGGSSSSGAMMVYPDVFSDQEVGMVQSGEIAGRLTRVLENLASDTEKADMMRKKIKSAMMYPIVVLTLLVAVIIAMMVFVVPKLTDLFASTNEELPLITRIVVGFSDFLIAHGLMLFAGFLAIFLGLTIFKKTELGKYMFDKFKLKIPVFGKLLMKVYLSRISRSLNNLLDSGVSILKTMEITAESVGNEVYRRRLMLALEDIKQGIPLAENLTESELFPPMMVNMIEVGEKTAQLDEIADKIAHFYEAEVDNTVGGLSKILEPMILIIIGLTVGAVVAAVMLPIMQLSNIASSL